MAKTRCGVLILALERADLYRRRLYAHQLRDNLSEDLPIAVAGTVVGLLDPACVDQIVNAVNEAEANFGCKVGLIVIDTYSKGIAADGGDEDKARDQNRAAANLTSIHARIDVHIALVGHTGKDEKRGARGSNAHLGDVDVMVMITGDGVRTADVVKGNDQPERTLAQFRIESVALGQDEDEDPITTSLVSDEQFETLQRKKSKKPLKPRETAAFRALFEIIADGETVPRPENVHVPVGATCVTRAVFRERVKSLRIINPDGSYRTEFDRICVTLRNAGFIGIWEDFVWPVTSVTK